MAAGWITTCDSCSPGVLGAATPVPTHPTQNPRSSVSCLVYCPVRSAPTKLEVKTKQLRFFIPPKPVALPAPPILADWRPTSCFYPAGWEGCGGGGVEQAEERDSRLRS